jgi:hypothetical protein
METENNTVGVMPIFTAGTWKVDKRTKIGKLITELTKCDDYQVQLGFTERQAWIPATQTYGTEPVEAFIVEANEMIHDLLHNEVFRNETKYGTNKNSYYATKLLYKSGWGEAECIWIQGTVVDPEGEATVVEINQGETATGHYRDWYEFLDAFASGDQLGRMFAKIKREEEQAQAKIDWDNKLVVLRETQPLSKDSERAIKVCEQWITKSLPYSEPATTEQMLENTIHFGVVTQMRITKNLIGSVIEHWSSEPRIVQYKEAVSMVLEQALNNGWRSDLPDLLIVPIIKKYQAVFAYF